MSSVASEQVAAVRRFNRFYTKQIGVLSEGLLESPFSLTQVRVLYELAHEDGPTATQIGGTLDLDAGYLSRILRGFERDGLVQREPSDRDARKTHLRLTPRGEETFAPLDARSRREVSRMLARLTEDERARLTRAMETIERLLDAPAEPGVPYILRPPYPGDMGWVVQRHGALYNREYGWNDEFEALVAEIVSQFLRSFDAARERCWIAEKDGTNVGSVFVVRHSNEVAKLRLLLVEPQARGLGIGQRLVRECVRFARQTGYERMTLWTNDVLHAARHIYEQAGFDLVDESPHHSFGHDLVGQTWELQL